ncbi:winged helix-turn-helix domain-containing protein [Aliamphritea spongicola]|uniref:winged helix-turn-helix domain-containing protein n=1 Tax=Aliamphritea spongicola TaxID=707589 RepID=UPI00196A7A2B|nr:crosslink repair DNA glycosylase YcaQ family protein [Aliamphritea spongicola]MBN3563165.1 YcaQ family DNA glycosylase [Aliamphritea spongicola]
MTAVSELSLAQARKLVLLAQGVQKPRSKGVKETLEAVTRLGYVQIDSISVVQRAHHHTLWNRVAGYHPDHLDALVAKKQVFEYWSHAAAYLPMRDYRFSLPRKQAIAGGDKHWFNRDDHSRLMQEIRARITAEGALMARDFEQPRKGTVGWWDWKPAKRALEQLFMEGELMAVERRGFQKVYDLAERALPDGIDTSVPDEREYLEYLIRRFLNANALAKPEQCIYLLKEMQKPLKQVVADMLEEGALISVQVGGESYLTLAGIEERMQQRLPNGRIRILSPFDNLLIQRKRMQSLFGFEYQLECYVPEPKRQYGYFVLPILFGSRFIGRMDVKAERKTGELVIKHLHFEQPLSEKILVALRTELQAFCEFNRMQQLRIDRISFSGKASGDEKQVRDYLSG